jgi:hypothetical protein
MLVASRIQKKHKEYVVWLPSTDKRVDLIVTNPPNMKMASIKIWRSKNFNHLNTPFASDFKYFGWWTLPVEKTTPTIDLCVLICRGSTEKETSLVVAEHGDFIERLVGLRQGHANKGMVSTYLWITNNNQCWETRELNQEEKVSIGKGEFRNPKRDFTSYLDSWDRLERILNM